MKEALKLALDELIHASSYCNTYDAIDAVKEALAQPEQEPVAWSVIGDGKFGEYELGQTFVDYEATHIYWENRGYKLVPIYTTPPEEQQSCDKRPWVGLTDEEREECTQSPFTEDNYDDLEAKLKEKNGG